MRLFDPQAPITVRVGATLMLVAVVLGFMREVVTNGMSAGMKPGIWAGVVAPIVGLVVGVIWARGIAQMSGLFYWFWVAMVSGLFLMIVILLPLSWAGVLGPWRSTPWTPLSMLEGICLAGSAVFLLAKPSVVAFWKRGSTGAKIRDVV